MAGLAPSCAKSASAWKSTATSRDVIDHGFVLTIGGLPSIDWVTRNATLT